MRAILRKSALGCSTFRRRWSHSTPTSSCTSTGSTSSSALSAIGSSGSPLHCTFRESQGAMEAFEVVAARSRREAGGVEGSSRELPGCVLERPAGVLSGASGQSSQSQEERVEPASGHPSAATDALLRRQQQGLRLLERPGEVLPSHPCRPILVSAGSFSQSSIRDSQGRLTYRSQSGKTNVPMSGAARKR